MDQRTGLLAATTAILLLMLAVLVYLLRRPGALRARHHQPMCWRCRYPLGGWQNGSCPECGCDAAKEGVAIARPRLRWFVVATVIVLWFFLLQAGAWLPRVSAPGDLEPFRAFLVRSSRWFAAASPVLAVLLSFWAAGPAWRPARDGEWKSASPQ
ncbi:MAG: hypothetical protein RL136_2069 [Planctomycetota bacterium]|jgi:hypothetical protein